MRISFFLFLAFSFFWSCSRLPSSFLSQNQEANEEQGNFKYQMIWAKNLDPNYETGNLPISSLSPTISNGILFQGSLVGELQAFNVENGRLIWKEKENEAISNKPTLYQQNIIYGTLGGRLVSRDYLTGKIHYAIDLGAPVESQASVFNDRLFVQLRNHALFCLDALTGKILWSYTRSVALSPTLQQIASPAVYDNKVYAGFADGYVAAFSVEEGVLLWERKIGQGTKFIDVDISPHLFNGLLYAAANSGTLTLMDPKTGEIRMNFGDKLTSSPVSQGENIIFGSENGHLIKMNARSEVVVKTKLPSPSNVTSVALWRNQIVAATTDGKVFFVEPVNFNLLKTFSLGGPGSSFYGVMEVGEEKLALFSARNRLYVFQ